MNMAIVSRHSVMNCSRFAFRARERAFTIVAYSESALLCISMRCVYYFQALFYSNLLAHRPSSPFASAARRSLYSVTEHIPINEAARTAFHPKPQRYTIAGVEIT
jgi:hypothetical protein